MISVLEVNVGNYVATTKAPPIPSYIFKMERDRLRNEALIISETFKPNLTGF